VWVVTPLKRGRVIVRRAVVAASAVVAALVLSSAVLAVKPQPVSFTQLLRVAFYSPSDGVGLFMHVTSTNNGRGRCVLSARMTADGGTSFGAAGGSIFSAACGSIYPIEEIADDGAGDLFTYDPGLVESHNDGRSWQRVNLGGTIVALSSVRRSVWALRVTGCPRYSGTCVLTLLVSADAGRSWRSAAHQPLRRRFPGVLAGAELSDPTALVRSSATAGTVVLPGTTHSADLTVEQTSDGGGTWNVAAAPCLASPSAINYSVAPTGARWVACAGEPGAGEQQKTFARSVDGGRSWQRGPTCPIGTDCDRGMPLLGSIDELIATSATTAFYVGGRSSLTETRNGGRSWTAEPGFSGDASGTSQVAFTGADDGWAIDEGFGGHAVLWRTRDGGTHWTRLATP
jgi:photosystem II stability/assembly factor-like uncharacterized protein